MRLLGRGRHTQKGEEILWWVKEGKLADRTDCRSKCRHFKTTTCSLLTREHYSAHQKKATKLTSRLISSPLDES